MNSQDHCVGGIGFRIYKKSPLTSKPLSILFLLHGRHGSLKTVDSTAKKLLNKVEENLCSLWIITLVRLFFS